MNQSFSSLQGDIKAFLATRRLLIILQSIHLGVLLTSVVSGAIAITMFALRFLL